MTQEYDSITPIAKERIQELSAQLVELIAIPDWETARAYGTELEALLPRVSPSLVEDALRNIGSTAHTVWLLGHWATVFESRQDYESCQRVENWLIDIMLNYLEKGYGKSEWNDRHFKDEVRNVLDAFEIQARRFVILGATSRAKEAMDRAAAASKLYDVPLDEGQQQLHDELNKGN